MELDYSINWCLGNCQFAKMKAYKKWMKVSGNWERIVSNTARCTTFTCEGRNIEEGKRTNHEKSIMQLISCFSCNFVSISLVYYIVYQWVCVYTYVYIHISVYIRTHMQVCILSFFGDITKNPFEKCHLRKFHFCLCSCLLVLLYRLTLNVTILIKTLVLRWPFRVTVGENSNEILLGPSLCLIKL